MELKYKIINQNDKDGTVGLHRIIVELCNNTYENSALYFSSFDAAKSKITVLSSLKHCPYVAKGTYAIDDNNKGIALLEPLVRLDSWIQRKQNLILWNHSGARCIGVGTDLRNIIFQVAKALESIHKEGRFHGNIIKGVMMGANDSQNMLIQ